jgi:hypothetical protein
MSVSASSPPYIRKVARAVSSHDVVSLSRMSSGAARHISASDKVWPGSLYFHQVSVPIPKRVPSGSWYRLLALKNGVPHSRSESIAKGIVHAIITAATTP